jgi:DnaJ homolog subfamily A member 2
MSVRDTEYYDVLGVSSDATESEIKKAFKKKAMKCHPDKHSQSPPDVKAAAEEEFKEIGAAYEVLSDPETRERYNRFGKEGLQGGPGPDMEDILRQFGMRGGMPFGFRQRAKPKAQMPNLVCPIKLTLPDIYAGTKVEFVATRFVLKEGVSPAKNEIICPQCKGMGQQIRLEQIGPGTMRQSQVKCNVCRGEGISISDKYFDKVNKTLKKTIPRGVIHGHQIVIPNAGHEIPPSMCKGSTTKTDLVIVIKEDQKYQVPDTDYTYVRGSAGSPFNLQLDVDIEPELAICGGFKEFIFIDGSAFLVRVPSGLVFRGSHDVVVEGRGLPVYGVHDTGGENKMGDLFIKFNLQNVELDDDAYAGIYHAITNRSLKKDSKKLSDSFGDVSDAAMSIEDYAESERLDRVKEDFQQFNRVFQTEKHETMSRRANEGKNVDDDVDSDTSDDEFEEMGGAPPGCAQQ